MKRLLTQLNSAVKGQQMRSGGHCVFVGILYTVMIFIEASLSVESGKYLAVWGFKMSFYGLIQSESGRSNSHTLCVLHR